MSNIIRTSNYRISRKLLTAASLMFMAVTVSGCSTFTRFDFPIFGLGDDESDKTSSVRGYGDVNRVYPPLSEEERSQRGSYYRSMYDREPVRRSDITRTELPEPDHNGRTEDYSERYNPKKRYSDNSRNSYSDSDSVDFSDTSSETRRRSARYNARDTYNRDDDSSVDNTSTGSITVVAGDTLYSLARTNRVKLAELKRVNGLRNNTIHVGQTLVLPSSDYVEPRKRYSNNYASSDNYDSYNSRNRYQKRYSRYEDDGYEIVSRKRKPARKKTYSNDYNYEQEPYRRTAKKRKKAYKRYAYNSYTDDPVQQRRRAPARKRAPVRRSYEPEQDRRSEQRNTNQRRQNERRDVENSARQQKAQALARKRAEEREVLRREQAAQAKAERERKIAARNQARDERLQAEREAEERARRERAEKEAEQKKIRLASRTEPKAEEEIVMPRTRGRFRWPVKGRIISKFGAKRNGARNDGINLSVPFGTDVKAAADGVVAYAGNELKGYGNLVLIRHRNNWVSAYAHNSKILVRRGQRIRRGHTIAKAGNSGSVSQPQVHFELRKEAKPVDPLKYM